jgi:hypothetical protein
VLSSAERNRQRRQPPPRHHLSRMRPPDVKVVRQSRSIAAESKRPSCVSISCQPFVGYTHDDAALPRAASGGFMQRFTLAWILCIGRLVSVTRRQSRRDHESDRPGGLLLPASRAVRGSWGSLSNRQDRASPCWHRADARGLQLRNTNDSCCCVTSPREGPPNRQDGRRSTERTRRG